MLYAHKQYIYKIEEVDDGDVLLRNLVGGKVFTTEKAFTKDYVSVEVKAKRKITYDENAWAEMGELVKQSNEEGQNYIFDVK